MQEKIEHAQDETTGVERKIINNELSQQVFDETYRYGTETVADAFKRVAAALAEVEENKEEWTEKFNSLLNDFKFVPGGRILSNAGIGLRGTTMINCFSGNTNVLTKKGLIPIKDVKIGDKVLTHKGRFKSVVSTMQTEHAQTLEIKFPHTDKRIKTSLEHPFLDSNDKWIQAKDLKEIRFLSKENESLQTIDLADYISENDIIIDDNKIYSEKISKFYNGSYVTNRSNPIERFITLDENFAYFLGRFTGDGSTFQQNKRYTKEGFNLVFNNKEKSEMDFIKTIIEEKTGLSMNINDNSNTSYLRKFNVPFSLFLSEFVGSDCYTKKVPELIWNSPKNVIKSYVLGLLDSDGMVNSRGSIVITLANKKLIEELQILLLTLNIPSKISDYTSKLENKEYYSKKLTISALESNKLKNDLKKYYEDDRLIVESKNNGISPFKYRNDFIISEQIELKKSDSDLLYNISVEEDESYVIEGVVVHNCFVDGFMGKDQDSMDGIMDALHRQAKILKSEGGYGFCADVMRPRGGFINGIANESPGSTKMLEMWDTQSAVITAGSGKKSTNKKAKGKIRKGAQMVTQSIWHPDVVEFITAKQTPGRLTKFNMSILVTDKFMSAVKNNEPWDLVFPDYEEAPVAYENTWDGNIDKWIESGNPVKVYHTFKNANELWDIVMESTYNRNEPGVLNVDTINRMNNLRYCEYISATNPCLVGSTKILTADGRKNITIKELSDIGEDVPVFTRDNKGKTQIRLLRNPRITGYNEPIYKITLDDGNFLRVTGNHKFLLTNGEYKETLNLQKGDSLKILTKYKSSLDEIFKGSNSKSSDYYWINDGKSNFSEHRKIAEFYQNTQIPKGYVVHHKDFNSLNNSPDNLEIMSKKDHDSLHGDMIKGDNNPMRRAHKEWSKEKWEDYKNKMSESVSGEKNGRYNGVSINEMRKYALELSSNLQRRFTENEWKEYCDSIGISYGISNWRKKHVGSFVALGKWAAAELGFEKFNNFKTSTIEKYKKYSSEGYDCELKEGVGIVFNKKCEVCGNSFKTTRREHMICGNKCNSIKNIEKNKSLKFKEKVKNSLRKTFDERKEKNKELQLQVYSDLKFKLKRNPLKKEWIEECKRNNIPHRIGSSSPFQKYSKLKEEVLDFNHKVVSVKFDGYEDVYNGTVDEFHNFFVGEFESTTKSGKEKLQYVNNLQCGEQMLPIGGVCLLGSFNLTQFVDLEKGDFDYDKLAKYIPIAVRFLDNVNDTTYVPLESQRANLKDKRRVGMGIMGYASALMMLQVKYGSEKALKMTENLMSFIANTAYQSSSKIAAEKGSFLLYDEEKYLDSNFIKMSLTEETQEMIRQNGMRNSHLLSIQPTGNCVSKNTKVQTDKGERSMKEIFKSNSVDYNNCPIEKWFVPTEEFKVKTLNGYSRVTGLFVKGKQEMFKVKTKNTSISAIGEHKVLVKLNDKEAIWKNISDLLPGETILIQPKQ